MNIDLTLGILSSALVLLMTVTIGGFALLFSRLDRLETKFDKIPDEFAMLRRELAEEFRSQRAEVSAQVTAITNAIIATRR